MNDSAAPAPQHAHADGSLRIRGRNILDIRLGPNDSGAATVREFLCELVKIAWFEKRHFGSTDWRCNLAEPLVLLGMINGDVNEDGRVEQYDDKALTDLIWEAIEVLSAEPFRPIGTKTSAERDLARLQRLNSGSRR